MKGHEVEKMLGIPKQTLLYYEREGLINPKRDSNDYRIYSNEEIDVLSFIQILRSIEISINDIKLIMNNDVSIKSVLENKKDFIQQTRIKLDDIDNKIKNFIKRKKVEISFDTENKNGSYDYLYLFDDYIKFCDEYIKVDDIVSIDISMFSSQGNSGMYFLLLNYYIDLDISVNNQIYSFEILNNSMVKNMFNYFESHSIKFNDPLNLNKIYHEISDPIKLNKYFNSHFREWANEYNLDNPRDNYYRIMKNNFIMPLEDIKNNPKPLIRNEFKELFRVWKEKIKNQENLKLDLLGFLLRTLYIDREALV